MLSPSLAQEIAGDTSAVIGFNVLITDDAGMVIGSGDSSRVGSFHEASVEVMHTQEPAAHTALQAQQLRGVRPGITLPLVMDGRAVGTVGITGTPRQVGRFGLLVKRQTEILLRESVMLRSRLLAERAAEKVLADIASYDPQVIEGEFITSRAAELGFDLRVRRIAVAIEMTAPDTVRALGRSELLRTVGEVFADPQDIVASTAPGWIGVLHRLPERRPVDSVTTACRRVVDTLGARVGIGEPTDSVDGLHDSYQDARDALRLGARLNSGSGGGAVHPIGGLRVHQFLAAAGQPARTRLRARTAAALHAQPDWPVIRATVIAWYESGFSLVRTAEALHVHRNTIVYRMTKIEQLASHSLRAQPTTTALYLACLADQLDAGV
ncbi:CdaR family transcriptional regulator [Streptomyces sp. NBC_01262]|uniref:CdaR family transcriptional regulator n=1 Tax=Streptomyces sp. NBC_01262 TaxID=2903803 RepID=UPI002E309704|nr:sugar diacid recognition domain-containing protein [Streptomyces sp. NBC_01262]